MKPELYETKVSRMTNVYGDRKFGDMGPNSWQPFQNLKSVEVTIDPRANFSEKAQRVDSYPKYKRFVYDRHENRATRAIEETN